MILETDVDFKHRDDEPESLERSLSLLKENYEIEHGFFKVAQELDGTLTLFVSFNTAAEKEKYIRELVDAAEPEIEGVLIGAQNDTDRTSMIFEISNNLDQALAIGQKFIEATFKGLDLKREEVELTAPEIVTEPSDAIVVVSFMQWMLARLNGEIIPPPPEIGH